MRKLLTISMMLLFVNSFAQRSFDSYQKMKFSHNFSKDKSELKSNADLHVLIPGNIENATGYFIYITEDGYVIGTNEYSDLAKGQVFKANNSYEITGAFFWVGAINGDSGDVHFKVWDFDESPGDVLGSKTIPIKDIEAVTEFFYIDELFYVEFESPVRTNKDFMIGFDVSDAGDSEIGIVHTDDGDGGGLDLVWEQWNDKTWHSMLEVWPIDIDIVVFPIVKYAPCKVTFNVDMTTAVAEGDIEFNEDIHNVYISGSFNNWIKPGENESYKLTPLTGKDDDKLVYTLTIDEIPIDQYYYKYFLVENEPSWEMGEWRNDDKDRVLPVYSDLIKNDVFGVLPPFVEPETVIFDLSHRNDVKTRIIWNGASEISKIVLFGNEINSNLFDIDSDTDSLTIRQNVFADAKYADIYFFTIKFDTEEDAIFVVLITDESELPVLISEADDRYLSVYPNPAWNILNINCDKLIHELRIFDISGRLVEQKYTNDQHTTLNVADYKQGIYILQIITDSGTYSRKIQISR